MPAKLALIHTSPSLTPLFDSLCAASLPGVATFHMVDESLIRNTIAAGCLQKLTTRRVIAQVQSAIEAGATAVLVTCSSIGAATSVAASLFDVPVIRIDDAMAERAVTLGRRIGVLATLKTTLDPTSALLRAKAAGSDIAINGLLCEGAFEAVMAGNGVAHDALVRAGLESLMEHVDVVVLAQASMARVLEAMPAGSVRVPVLSSPALAVQRVAQMLAGEIQAAGA